jgi:predicted PurR-regulated permease PerM
MEQKIDLNKLEEKDWIKYRRMKKIANNENAIKSIINILPFVLIFGVVISLVLISQPQISHLNTLLNYITNQTGNALHNQFNLSTNTTTYNLTILPNLLQNKSTTSKLISISSSNSIVLGQLTVMTLIDVQDISVALFTVVMIFMLLWAYGMLAFGYDAPSSPPSSFKSLKRRLSRKQNKDDNLRAHGFSEREISWYYAVRLALVIELSIM